MVSTTIPSSAQSTVQEVRNILWFLARKKPGRNLRDFKIRVEASGDSQYITQWVLEQDTGGGVVELVREETEEEFIQAVGKLKERA